MNFSIDKCSLINVPLISDERGSLVYYEFEKEFNFPILRNYIIFDVPSGHTRGHHAHKSLEQIIVCLHGTFDVEIFDGKNSRLISLSSPNMALYICPMIWRVMKNFSDNAVCSVLASQKYDENDYIRDKNVFLKSVLE